jgi:thiamine biosynthesis lipoprotein
MRIRVPFRAMASEHAITVDGDDEAIARTAIAAAIADVHRIEAKYSRYRDDSVTTAINRSAGGRPIAIDAETESLLRYADQCHALSGGRFDITSGVLRRAWDFRRDPPRVPQQLEIDALLPLIGWPTVELGKGTVRLPRPGMQIDFGGIGKEYAADRAMTLLQQHGVAHALVNLGGDVRATGGQAGGAAWRIGIVHPRRPETAIASMEIVDGAVATSGDYERFFVHEGKRYCHVVDATTGWPVDAWQSISVVAPVCVYAGSCATIAMLLGEGAGEFLATQNVAWLGVNARGGLRGSVGSAGV